MLSKDNWLGVPLEDSPRVYRAGYTEAAGSLGLLWEKAVYRGYTDATFSNYTETADWMGINGPIVRAEVGDMIEMYVARITNGEVVLTVAS